MTSVREEPGVTASIEPPSKVMIWRPFGVYLVWADGDKKLVCLCPDESMPDLVAKTLSAYYRPLGSDEVLPIEDKNGH